MYSLLSFRTQAIDDDCNQTGQMTAGFLDWPQVRLEWGASAEDQAWGLRTQPPLSLPFWREAGVKQDGHSSGQEGGAHSQDPRPHLGLHMPLPQPVAPQPHHSALPQGLCTDCSLSLEQGSLRSPQGFSLPTRSLLRHRLFGEACLAHCLWKYSRPLPNPTFPIPVQ